MSSNVQYVDVHDQVVYTPYGWCSFPHLDHFNTDLLLDVLLSKDSNGQPAVWKTSEIPQTASGSYCLSNVALMQLEALFNLSQVMFALYNGDLKQVTFRDLHLQHAPRDIRTAGFRKIGSGGTNLREALHSVAWDIVEAGALPVIFSMYKNPVLPMVKQKTLDALTNLLNVEKISKHILRDDPWFLDETVTLIRNGDLTSEKIPAASCVGRMIVAILCLRLKKEFNNLVELKYVDAVLSVLQDKALLKERSSDFCKFETIILQSISMLLQDGQYMNCSEDISNQLYSYAYESVLKWEVDDPCQDSFLDTYESHDTFGFATGRLVFSLIILVHITKSSVEKKQVLASDTKFEHQLLSLWESYGPQSALGRINTGVMNAIADLHSGLFDQAFLSDRKNSGLSLPHLSVLRNKVKRHCSNHQCQKVETKVQEFKVCSGCHLVCYCSVVCQKLDWKKGGHKRNCKLLRIGVRKPRSDTTTENNENEENSAKQVNNPSDENEILTKRRAKSHADAQSPFDKARDQIRSPLKDINKLQNQPGTPPAFVSHVVDKTDRSNSQDNKAYPDLDGEPSLKERCSSEQTSVGKSLAENPEVNVEITDHSDCKTAQLDSNNPFSMHSFTDMLESIDGIINTPTTASQIYPNISQSNDHKKTVIAYPPLLGEHILEYTDPKKPPEVKKINEKLEVGYDADSESTSPLHPKFHTLSPIPESDESSEIGSSFCDKSLSTTGTSEDLSLESSNTTDEESSLMAQWSIEASRGSEVPSISQSICSVDQSGGIASDDDDDDEIVLFDIRKRKEYQEELKKEEMLQSEKMSVGDEDDDDEACVDEITSSSNNELSTLFQLIRDVTNVSDDGLSEDYLADQETSTEGGESVGMTSGVDQPTGPVDIGGAYLNSEDGGEGIDGPLERLIKLVETLFPECAEDGVSDNAVLGSSDLDSATCQKDAVKDKEMGGEKMSLATRLTYDVENNDQQLFEPSSQSPSSIEGDSYSESCGLDYSRELEVSPDVQASGFHENQNDTTSGAEKFDDSSDIQEGLLGCEQADVQSPGDRVEDPPKYDNQECKDSDNSREESKPLGDGCLEVDQNELEDLEHQFLDDDDDGDDEASSEWSLDISYDLEDSACSSSSDPEEYIITFPSDLPNEDSDDQFQLALDSFTETSDSDEYTDSGEYFPQDKETMEFHTPITNSGIGDLGAVVGLEHFSARKTSLSDNSLDGSPTVKEDTSCDRSRLSSESDTLEGETIDAVLSACSERISSTDSESDEFHSPMRHTNSHGNGRDVPCTSISKSSSVLDEKETPKEVGEDVDGHGSLTCNIM